jgi:hypothetical protein
MGSAMGAILLYKTATNWLTSFDTATTCVTLFFTTVQFELLFDT